MGEPVGKTATSAEEVVRVPVQRYAQSLKADLSVFDMRKLLATQSKRLKHASIVVQD